jgi:hypothetical protein
MLGNVAENSRLICFIAALDQFSLVNAAIPTTFVLSGHVRRFGNAFYQLCNALHIAGLFRATDIYVPPRTLFLKSAVTTANGVTIHPTRDAPRGHVLRDSFWDIPQACRVNHRAIGLLLSPHVIAALPNVSLDPTVLAVHVRGGDIFNGWTNEARLYGQPPCRFYMDAIRIDNHSSVEVFAEDDANPCMEVIFSLANVKWRHQSLREDLALMLSAKRFVLARSSFSRSIVYLSPVDKIFYACSYPWPDLGPHFECTPPEEYAQMIFARWSQYFKSKKIMAMRTEKCLYWGWFNGSAMTSRLEI